MSNDRIQRKLRTYLDNAIISWRKRRDETQGEDQLVARCYVDAFQSVRLSMLGELLPAASDAGIPDSLARDFGPSDTTTFCSSGPELTPGLALIAAERRRQVEEEGWTPEHDGQWQSKELIAAAACYLLHDRLRFPIGLTDIRWPKQLWPETWSLGWWKPGSYAHNLVLAGALIAAELDRLIREEGRRNDG